MRPLVSSSPLDCFLASRSRRGKGIRRSATVRRVKHPSPGEIPEKKSPMRRNPDVRDVSLMLRRGGSGVRPFAYPTILGANRVDRSIAVTRAPECVSRQDLIRLSEDTPPRYFETSLGLLSFGTTRGVYGAPARVHRAVTIEVSLLEAASEILSFHVPRTLQHSAKTMVC